MPPTGYGGIEWVVSLLADGLTDAGHDVTLFASGDSRTRAKLSAVYEHAPSEQIGRSLRLSSIRAFGRQWDVRVDRGHVTVEEV